MDWLICEVPLDRCRLGIPTLSRLLPFASAKALPAREAACRGFLLFWGVNLSERGFGKDGLPSLISYFFRLQRMARVDLLTISAIAARIWPIVLTTEPSLRLCNHIFHLGGS
ncbi:hypothetical protein VK70_16085 [Paenibacillus durus ATCC 35681]|uniref:Uncharacterized protein n=1 Tax=Paenibacillus durus ATCC 35681 TaxID=1333534 RepID=A0A0F7FAZ0_PAEDU|nr:hypothetical protein VK70_16085 [Paenibacillus durus ATCC 35681]